MHQLIKLIILAVLLSAASVVYAQPKVYTTANTHALYDYANSMPFYGAYARGIGSVGVDVFVAGGKLITAHNTREINPKRSLKTLYLDPLTKKLSKDVNRSMILMINIKQDYHTTLPLVVKEMQPLIAYASSGNKPGRLKVIMTGALPPPAEFDNYPGWLFFGVDHFNGFTVGQWQHVSLLHLQYKLYSTWDGTGKMPANDFKKLSKLVKRAHASGKLIHFWETPDNETSWNTLESLGVDLIDTYDVKDLADFLNKKAG